VRSGRAGPPRRRRGAPCPAELLGAFAAVLGVPASVPAAVTGLPAPADQRAPASEPRDTAALIWEVRHLPADQEHELARYAHDLAAA
jgi:hypothetical protein